LAGFEAAGGRNNEGHLKMCDLYSISKGQAAIIAFTRATRDTTGNLELVSGISANNLAPIVRNAPDGVRELTLARWGIPAPHGFNSTSITNIRNTNNRYWWPWLKTENRCVVPWTSFCEYAQTIAKKTPTWFAINEERPLAFFSAIWANPFQSERPHFGFLTTEANDVVGAIHPDAMPVILTTPEEVDIWMTAPEDDILRLQRPLPDGTLKIVSKTKS
jgi:putative SOS response-associated peptidase YedK